MSTLDNPPSLSAIDTMAGLRYKLQPREMRIIRIEECGFPQSISDLIEFTQSVVFPEHGPGNKLVGRWYPIVGKHPETVIPYLYLMFKDLFEKCKSYSRFQNPRLLECGSGYGTVGSIASLVGFDVYNIELQEDIHLDAIRYAQVLVDRGVVDLSRLHYVHGSYYDGMWFDFAAKGFMQAYGIENKPYQDRPFDPASLKLNLCLEELPTREQAKVAVSKLGRKTWALRDSGIVNVDGYFDIDVVHIYPSDPLFDYGFIQQMEDMLYSHTYVVFPELNSQIIKAINDGRLRQGQFDLDMRYRKITGDATSMDYLAFLSRSI